MDDYDGELWTLTMAKCNPFGHITHIIGFIEMLCLNYFDLVTGNPTFTTINAQQFKWNYKF